MTRWAATAVLVAMGCAMALGLAGCGPAVGGPRFWWNDRKREKLPADYQLPPAPQDPAEATDEEDEAEPAKPAEAPPAKPATPPPGAGKSSAGAIPGK